MKGSIAKLLLFILLTAGTCLADESMADARFPRPASLEPAIEFWTRVYTEVETNGGFVHDNRRLNVVYEQLRFDPGAGPKAQRKAYRKAIERYRQALLSLAGGKRRNLNAAQRRALALWGEQATRETFETAAANVRFQRGQADKFRAGIARSARWKPFIVETLRKEGLPIELAALPHVESSYNPKANSHAGAAGLWQFMPATGRRFMRVDHVLDERLDSYKATQAAAALLRHNHAVLKSWPLAITAYNHGLSGMRRAAKHMGTRDIGVIIERYRGRRFGFASRNFYPAFLAALDVSQRPADFFGELPPPTEKAPVRVATQAYIAADALAENLGIPEERLRQLNPALQRSVWNGDKLVPKGYDLRLPPDYPLPEAGERLRIAALNAGFTSQKPDRFYTVRQGDTLSHIAHRYQTSVSYLMAMNHLPSRHRIRIGQRLRLPQGPEPQPAAIEERAKLAAQAETMAIEVELSGKDRGREAGPTLAALETGGEGAMIGSGQAEPMAEPAPPDAAAPQDTAADDSGRLLASAGTPDDGAGLDETEGSVPVEPQPALSADPANYQVSDSGTIEVQASETLGHYADWLGLKTSRLRKLNGLRYRQPVIVGQTLELDFSKVDRNRFEQARIDHHQTLQSSYFEGHRIVGTREHRIRSGDGLWLLATRDYGIPFWLLRQYNPDLDPSTVLPLGFVISVPVVQRIEPDCEVCVAATGVEESNPPAEPRETPL